MVQSLLIIVIVMFSSAKLHAGGSGGANDGIPVWKATDWMRFKKSSASDAMKDTVTVVNFWATWCAPCVEELPRFVQADSALRAEGKHVRFLMVSLDFKRDLHAKLIPFVNRNIPTLSVVLLSEREMDAFIGSVDKRWSGALPATVILRPRSAQVFVEGQITEQEIRSIVTTGHR